MQIRVYAESAAFYQAGGVEEKKTNQKLDQLISTQRKLIHWEFALNSMDLFNFLVFFLPLQVFHPPLSLSLSLSLGGGGGRGALLPVRMQKKYFLFLNETKQNNVLSLFSVLLTILLLCIVHVVFVFLKSISQCCLRFFFCFSLRGFQGCLMSSSCLESQGICLIPISYLSCFAA